MRTLYRVFSYALLACTVYLAGQPAVSSAQADSSGEAQELLRRVESTYDDMGGLQATFTQTVRSDFSDDVTRLRGMLSLQGEKYRVETAQQTIVTDGETTWIYNPADAQVIVNNHVENETAFSPQAFFANYTERYTVEAVRTEEQDGELHHVLRLTPNDASAPFDEVTLWVRSADALIQRMRVHDRNGSVITVDLENIDLNPTFSAETFAFSPPKSAEVVDLRS